MGGIAGRFNFDPTLPIDRSRLEAMTVALAHRGPDADGFHIAPGIGLGHRRKNISDLATGDQPFANEDGTVWVVFDGEIFNCADTRAELETKGHRFRTRSDTEVIVHAYEEWADECVHRFRGMFACAIWDDSRRRLLLVRDRVGIKPLHYSATRHGVVFGSEIKALLEDDSVSREWRPEALDAFLAFQYIPGPQTIFSNIWKLPPGHLLVAERGHVAVRRYWDLTFTGDGEVARENEYLERLEALVDESVRLQLNADVPIGALLSGGVDSSLVVAAMTATCPGRVLTTSVGFGEHASNELEHARAVSKHLGTDAHERIVTPDVVDLLSRLAWHGDEPFADASAVRTYCVSAAARERVTVVLSGDGGDEVWAGYTRYRVEQREARARALLGQSGAKVAGHLVRRLPHVLKSVRALRHLAMPPAEACARKAAYGFFEFDERDALYTGDFAIEVRDADPFAPHRLAYESCPSADPLDRAMYVDVKTSLVDDILTKVDRMSMAVSLEARVPLADHKLLEFAATVPSALKLRNGRSKYLLRRLLDRRVPASIVNGLTHGFEAPIGTWLRGPLASMVDDLFLDGRLKARGIFDAASIERLWREHRSGARDHRHRLWSLVMLELWFRRFVDGEASREAAAA
jgi:asparagine synthase (glutamine-hydrolysing)